MFVSRSKLALSLVLSTLILSSLVFFSPIAAQSADCAIDVSSPPALTEAIIAANNGAGCATIQITESMTLDEVTPPFESVFGANAFPTITASIIIEGNGFTIERAETSSNFRFFAVDGSASNAGLTLNNITLIGGRAQRGGAVYVKGGTTDLSTPLTVTNSTLLNNRAVAGGAILIDAISASASLVINGSTLENNAADEQGGAIYNDARSGGSITLNLEASTLTNNNANREGDAIYTNTSPSGVVIGELVSTGITGGDAGNLCFNNGSGITIAEDGAADSLICGNEVYTAPACAFVVGDSNALVNAIDQANDEALCPGPDTIQVTADIQVAGSYDGGENAFPLVTSSITIDGTNGINQPFTISRDASAPEFRFFFVDGKDGNSGNLTLRNLALTGGYALDGGAVFVDGTSGGNATITADGVSFAQNTAAGGNGGAVFTVSFNGGTVNTTITNSFFVGNAGLYGGAFYSGAFDNGNANAVISNSVFSTNTAAQEGGAIYNNGLNNGGSSPTLLTIQDSTLTENSAPVGGAIYNNGTRAGNAEVALSNTTFSNNVATSGAGDAIFSNGLEGNTLIRWEMGGAGGNQTVCISDDSGVLATIDCP